MRFGLIGDVHAENETLALVLEAFRRERVQQVLCTGNLVDGEGDVDRTCALLVAAGAIVVRGNHDRWIRSDERRDVPHAHRMTELAVPTVGYLKDLPKTVTLPIPGGTLLLCHGVGPNDMRRLEPETNGQALSSNDELLAVLFDPTMRIMVGGHTRRPMLRHFQRGAGKAPLVAINPGTLARREQPGFVVLDVGTSQVDFHRIVDGRTERTTCGML